MVVNRPHSVPMTWKDGSDVAIDMTGMTVTAELRLGLEEPEVVEVDIEITDETAGEFRVYWLAAAVANLPEGTLSELRVVIVDTSGQYNEIVLPVNGESR